MDSEKEIYEIEFTQNAKDEIEEIYKYISENLKNRDAAKRLMKKMRDNIMNLNKNPKIYMKVETKRKIRKEFRRMVVNNYVILYTVDEERKKVYISHMYYGKRNYV